MNDFLLNRWLLVLGISLGFLSCEKTEPETEATAIMGQTGFTSEDSEDIRRGSGGETDEESKEKETVTPERYFNIVSSNVTVPIGESFLVTTKGSIENIIDAEVRERIEWSTSDPEVLFVDNLSKKGNLIGITKGVATVTAKFEELEQKFEVAVVGEGLINITINPTVGAMNLHTKFKLSVLGFNADNTATDLTEASAFSVGNKNVLALWEIDGIFYVKAVAPGKTYVKATFGSFKYKMEINVLGPELLDFTIDSRSTYLVGEKLDLTITATYDNNSVENIADRVKFTTSIEGLVSFDQHINGAFINPAALGDVDITVKFGGIEKTISIRVLVNEVFHALGWDIDANTIKVPLGEPLNVNFLGYSANGTFAIDSIGIFNDVSVGGLFTFGLDSDYKFAITPIAVGTGTISGEYLGLTASVLTVIITDVAVTSIEILPVNDFGEDNETICGSELLAFEAMATYSDGSTGYITAESTWSGGGGLAFDSDNKFYSNAPGDTSVTADFLDPVTGNTIQGVYEFSIAEGEITGISLYANETETLIGKTLSLFIEQTYSCGINTVLDPLADEVVYEVTTALTGGNTSELNGITKNLVNTAGSLAGDENIDLKATWTVDAETEFSTTYQHKIKVEEITSIFISAPASVVTSANSSYVERTVTEPFIIEATKSNYLGGTRMTYAEIIADGATISLSSEDDDYVTVDALGNVTGVEKQGQSTWWKATELTLDINGIEETTKIKVRSKCPLNDPSDVEGDGDLTTGVYTDNWGCYYLGASGQSCDDVCTTGSLGAGVGAVDTVVGIDHIGSNGFNWGACRNAMLEIKRKFSLDPYVVVDANLDFDAFAADPSSKGVGCFLAGGENYRFITPPTNSAHAVAGFQRVCACKAGGS